MANANEQEQTADAVEPTAGGRPIMKFNGSGGLSVAIWKHQPDVGPSHYSIHVDRSFKDGAGQFQSTTYLREGDLLRVQKLLGQADDWIEQDRMKQRSANAGREQGTVR